ncbi:MAG: DUF6512 family protein [Angelakisella sp.]
MKIKGLSSPERWILLGIPCLFLIGSVMHFIYDLTGQRFLVGLVAPTNESVWEHLKMVVLPLILWWTLYYAARGSYYRIGKDRWYTAALVSLLTSLIVIPCVFYFYTEAFGVELLIVDILILLLALLCGQLLGFHFYHHFAGISWITVSIIFFLIVGLFAWFTIYPPALPIFQSP